MDLVLRSLTVIAPPDCLSNPGAASDGDERQVSGGEDLEASREIVNALSRIGFGD